MSTDTRDLEASLATALAELEVKRLRVKRLQHENVHLRNVLRAHDIPPGDIEGDVPPSLDTGAHDENVSEPGNSAGHPASPKPSQRVEEGEYEATIVAAGAQV